MKNFVELYLADIRLLGCYETECIARLSPERREKVAVCRRQEDRLLIVAAGLLLFKVLNIQPGDDLQRNKYGKPELTVKGMHFNLSYSGNYAVLALAHTTVGVDIERVANDPPAVLPRNIFMPDELLWLEEQFTPERYAFLWTRLESAIKADGRGFGMERRDFSVVESGHPWHLQTLIYDRHIISCALKDELETSLTLFSRDELLS